MRGEPIGENTHCVTNDTILTEKAKYIYFNSFHRLSSIRYSFTSYPWRRLDNQRNWLTVRRSTQIWYLVNTIYHFQFSEPAAVGQMQLISWHLTSINCKTPGTHSLSTFFFFGDLDQGNWHHKCIRLIRIFKLAHLEVEICSGIAFVFIVDMMHLASV